MEYVEDEDADAEVAEEVAQAEVDEDVDAEGETDEDALGSEADAEAVEDDLDDDDEDEIVGAVKTRPSRRTVHHSDEDDSDGENEEARTDDDDESSNAEVEEDDWEGDDDAREEASANGPAENCCIFCGQDEEHDPCEEFEEYLSCSVCGDNAHRQCARDAGILAPDEDASDWRCKDCVSNGLEADFKNVPDMLASRRRSSAPKMARDLLPAARGGINPDSHSVFNTLILDEDPMDGSRALRKRKTPSHDPEELPRSGGRKRRKPGVEELDEHAVDEGGDDAAIDDQSVASASPKSRASRPQRHNNKVRKRGAWIVSRSDNPRSCIIGVSITAAQWDEMERDGQRKQRRRERDRLRRARNSRRAITIEPEEPGQFPAVQTSIYTNPFYAFPDRETDENKGKPYGGILTEAEADTSRNYPQDADRQAFQDARLKAEQQWKEKIATMNGEINARPKGSSGPPSKIKCINFGQYEIDTWHAAPYPEEYSRNKHLYICEFCLKYMSSDYVAWRHKLKCSAKCPPGDEIYRSRVSNPETGAETTLSFFEVDGRRNPLYCQNLCLLAKLFLGSKTLYYDVEPFLFYIMTENDDFGCHFVGYFSKEKRGCGPLPPPFAPYDELNGTQSGGPVGGDLDGDNGSIDPVLSNPGNNVSCILVLPVHMRRGFGRVLIEFSYLLTQVEGRTGSPEKPLSDMGLVSYRSYWRTVLCRLLLRYQGNERSATEDQNLSVASIARETGMTPDDIISTLEALRFLVRDPITRQYALRLDYDYMKEYVDKQEQKAAIRLDPERLCWTPYVMGRPTNLFAMGEEASQPMSTVAPRDEPGLPVVEIGSVAPQLTNDGDTIMTSNEPGEAFATALSSADSGVLPSESEPLPNPPSKSPVFSALTRQSSWTDRQNISPQKTPNGTTSHHRTASDLSSQSDSNGSAGGHIPPTRFEVFPPIPGMASSRKRGPGRPPRSGRRSGHGTPRRSRSSLHYQQSPAGGAASLRRTRSKLGEVSLVDDDDDVEAKIALDADAEMDDDERDVEDDHDDDEEFEDAPDADEEADADGDDDDADEIKYE